MKTIARRSPRPLSVLALAALAGALGACNSGTSIQQDSINASTLRAGQGTVAAKGGTPSTRAGDDAAGDPAGGGGGTGSAGDPTKAPARGSDDPTKPGSGDPANAGDPTKKPDNAPATTKPAKITSAQRQAAAKAELDQIRSLRGKLLGAAAPAGSNRGAIARQVTALHNRAMRLTAIAYPTDYARRQAALADRYRTDMASLSRKD
jgi:hypothetical protein